MSSRRRGKAVVVAHDAGGAEVIAAYVAASRARGSFVVYASGPAVRIFRRRRIPVRVIAGSRAHMKKIFAQHREAALALIGTGWMTGTERRAIKAAKRAGIKTCVYLDAWKNYRERFGYPRAGWKSYLPDEIWVGDSAAHALARRLLPCRIKRVKGAYIREIQHDFKRARLGAPREILFLSAPEKLSERILSALLLRFSRTPRPPVIRIRLHPTDARGRYARFSRYRAVRVVLSRKRDLSKDLARARAAIGYETTALALAGKLGLLSVTVSPERVVLPFPNMLRARTPEQGVRLLERKGALLKGIK